MATEAGVKAFAERNRAVIAHHALSLGDGDSMAATLKSVTGGKVSMNRADLVVADGPHGREVLVQPFAGNTPLPGELHVLVAGAFIAPAAYDDSGFFGFSWNSPDEDLQSYLREQKFAAHTLPEQLKHGLTAIKLGWTVQVQAVAADRSSICCQLGGFSGSGAHAAALTVVDQLAPAIAQSRTIAPTASVHPTRFGRFAELAFDGRLETFLAGASSGQGAAVPPVPEPLDPISARAAIEAALSHHGGKRVVVGTVTDAKKLRNITAKIARNIDPAEICGFVDTGIRASGKAGVVFTPSAVHINELGDHHHFQYSAIASFRLDGSELTIRGMDGSSVKIASHGEAAIIMESLVAATGRTG